MTHEEAAANYPGAVDAVLLFESCPTWQYFRDQGLSPAAVVDFIIRSSGRIVSANREKSQAVASVICPQLSSPDFLRYVAGKLGAC